MRLYFLRHAQSVGNVGGEPDQSRFGSLSDKGLEQAERLPDRLQKYEFDEIIVSPLERALRTIAPYLRKAGRTAEVWPEMVEARGNKHKPAEVPPEVRYGDTVVLPDDICGLFRMRDDKAGRFLPPADETYQEGQRRVTLAAERVVRLFGGKEIAVLAVGHACSGARFIEALMRIPLDGRFGHRNTGLTSVHQKANGDFDMSFMNRVSEIDETEAGVRPP